MLEILLPCLTKNIHIEEIDLAANELDDRSSASIAMIVQAHQETKDHFIWQYGLRNEKPPRFKMQSLKRLDVSHNKFTRKSAFAFSRVIESDTYMRCLNLGANEFDEEAVGEFHEGMKSNYSVFNLDLRENPGLTQKLHRQLALRMLKNYTRVGQDTKLEDPEAWKAEQRYFNSKLLIVEIPNNMFKVYAKKLEAIRNNCFDRWDRPSSAQQRPSSSKKRASSKAKTKKVIKLPLKKTPVAVKKGSSKTVSINIRKSHKGHLKSQEYQGNDHLITPTPRRENEFYKQSPIETTPMTNEMLKETRRTGQQTGSHKKEAEEYHSEKRRVDPELQETPDQRADAFSSTCNSEGP